MKYIYLLIVTLMLAGCGGEEFGDLQEFVKNSGADLRGKIPPPPEVKPYEYFEYVNDDGLPSPFEPRKEEVRAGVGGPVENQPDMERPKEALEDFPLESMKMVGYLFRDKVGYAIVRADNKLYRVQPGNYIGQNFGLIQEIHETEMIIKEMIQDSAGAWTERMSSIQLQE